MKSLMNVRKTLIAVLALAFAISGFAAGDKKHIQGETTRVENVKTLLKDVDKFSDKMVSVQGKVEGILDDRTFILESGGFFNNEIVVFLDKGTESALRDMIKEDAKLIVKGKLRPVSVTEIEKEHNWKFGKEVREELRKGSSFILASDLMKEYSE